MARVRSLVPALIVLAGFLFAGCDQDLGSGIVIDNKTSEALRFSALLDQGWYEPVDHAPPHGTATVLSPGHLNAKGCTAGGMIAFTLDGREVARHDEPLCLGDRWVIGAPAPSGSS